MARYCISACIMAVCAVVQMALQMQTGAPGHFLLLPGIFLSGLIFNRGSGVLAAVIAVGVGAYASYSGELGLDYRATNALFAITAAVGVTLPLRGLMLTSAECRKKWTEQEHQILKAMAETGSRPDKIAAVLGRSEAAVRVRAWQHDIPLRLLTTKRK